MKAIKFRLLAMIITLAAVITSATTLNAQRRSTGDPGDRSKVENTRSGNNSNNEKKSATRETAKESRSSNRSVSNSREVNKNASVAPKEAKRESGRTTTSSSGNRNTSVNQRNSGSNSNQKQAERVEPVEIKSNREDNARNSNSVKTNSNPGDAQRRSTNYPATATRNSSNNTKSYDPGRSSVNRTERYNHNTRDTRYTPGREYRGSNNYWSSDVRNVTVNYYQNTTKYRIKNKYYSYHYWDTSWENYCWNHNSWINYYSYYNPHWYKSYRYYYHHPHYGHVIRKFGYRPQIFIHNHNRYYCFEGNFFRYFRGIGYVLVDVPFGMTFEYLPDGYERVHINGYLYFRVGNLFFEASDFGFQLVYYPERYYSYNDDYPIEGYRFYD